MATHLRNLRLSELSLVDRPANKGARVTIFKRDGEVDDYSKRNFTAEERQQGAKEGWAKPDGSYPIRNTGDLENAIHAWGRGGATASDKEWIIRRAKALGATSKLPDNWVSKSEVDNMTTEELNKAIADAVAKSTATLTTQTADLSKQLKTAQETITKMGSDNKKKPQADTSGDDNEPDEDDATKRATWKAYVGKAVAKAVAATKDEIAKVNAEDEVIKSGDVEFRKSQTDPGVFAFMKAQQKQIADGVEKSELADFTKRAETEFSSLPGEPVAKGKMLRAVAKMDEADRKAIEVALKAGNAAMKAGFSELGKNTGVVEGSATDKLDKLAEEHALKNNISKAVAYDAILKTDTGRELYAQTRKERPTAQRPN